MDTIKRLDIPVPCVDRPISLLQVDSKGTGTISDLNVVGADGTVLFSIPKQYIKFFCSSMDIFSEEEYPLGKPIPITIAWLDSLPEIKRVVNSNIDYIHYSSNTYKDSGFYLTTDIAGTHFTLSYFTNPDRITVLNNAILDTKKSYYDNIEINFQHELLTFFTNYYAKMNIQNEVDK